MNDAELDPLAHFSLVAFVLVNTSVAGSFFSVRAHDSQRCKDPVHDECTKV